MALPLFAISRLFIAQGPFATNVAYDVRIFYGRSARTSGVTSSRTASVTGWTCEFSTAGDHPDRFGRDNVSRVIVGGSIEESGIPTIGVA
jgi:hypothetical protein